MVWIRIRRSRDFILQIPNGSLWNSDAFCNPRSIVEDKQRDWDLFGCGDRGKSDVNTFLERQLNRE